MTASLTYSKLSSSAQWLLKKYEDLVRSNQESLSTIEEAARSTLLLFPGRFGDSEVSSETSVFLKEH